MSHSTTSTPSTPSTTSTTSEPTNLTSIPTLTTLYQTARLRPSSTDPGSLLTPSAVLNSKVSLIRADITTLAVTCIVNAANNSLLGGGGVDGAIHAAAGPSLLTACRRLDGCATGSAKITPAFDLPSKHIIHAVGPVYASARRKREGLERELLASAYRRSLELAAEAAEEGDEDEGPEGTEKDQGQGAGKRVALPCLSTGIYGYPSPSAAEVACSVVREFLSTQEASPKAKGKVCLVIFCCFLEKDVLAYEQSLPKWFPPTRDELAAASAPDTEADTADDSAPTPAADHGHSEDELSNEDWIPVEKPEPQAQGAMENSTSMSEEGEKIEGADVSEGEKIEGAETSDITVWEGGG